MPENLEPGKPKRRRRWKRLFLRILGSLLVTTVIGSIGYAYTRHKQWEENEKDLADAIKETDELDPRWRLEEIEADRPITPDDKNSAKLIEEFGMAIEKLDKKVFKEKGFTTYIADIPPNEAMPTEDAAELERWLNARAPAISLARRFIHYPIGRFSLSFHDNPLLTLMKHLQIMRTAWTWLCADMEFQTLRGNTSAAWEDLHSILLMTRSLREEPFGISQLIRVAGRTTAIRRMERLMAMDPEPTAVMECQRRLLEEINDPTFYWCIRGERATIHRFMENYAIGKASLSGFSESHDDDMSFIPRYVFAPYVPFNHAYMLRWFNQFFTITEEMPLHEQSAAMRALPMPPREYKYALTLLFPALFKLHDASLREQTLLRCGIVALAVEKYRLDRGTWPKALADLPADLLKEIPLDPFDGKPLRYLIKDDGVVIYSVGMNRIDDGGKLSNNQILEPDSDFGLKLWNPEFRHLPAVKRDPKPPAKSNPFNRVREQVLHNPELELPAKHSEPTWIEPGPNADNAEIARLAAELASRQVPIGLKLIHCENFTPSGLAALSVIKQLVALEVVFPERTTESFEGVARLTSLQKLTLTGDAVKDADLQYLSGLKQLRSVIINSRSLTEECLVHIAALPELESLRVLPSNSLLTDRGLAQIGKMHALRQLLIAGDGVTIAGMQHLKGMTRLNRLTLEGTSKLSPESLDIVASLPELESLSLIETPFKSPDLAPLAKLSKLKKLALDRQYGDAAVKYIGHIHTLEELDLSDRELTDAALPSLAGLVNLRSLHLEDNQITDESTENLKALIKLEKLWLDENPLGDRTVSQLGKMTKLKELSLRGTKVTDAAVNMLKNHPSLESLTLTKTAVTDEAITALLTMKKLKRLGLSQTKISKEGIESIRSACTDLNLIAD